MKYGISFLIGILFISAQPARMSAQDSPSAAQAAQELRNQLSQLNDRDAEIKIRLQELDYELVMRRLSSVMSLVTRFGFCVAYSAAMSPPFECPINTSL